MKNVWLHIALLAGLTAAPALAQSDMLPGAKTGETEPLKTKEGKSPGQKEKAAQPDETKAVDAPPPAEQAAAAPATSAPTSEAKGLTSLAEAKSPLDLGDPLNAAKFDALVNQQGLSQAGLADVGADALQVLGQVIVDKVSTQGFSMLKDRVETSLACNQDSTQFHNVCGVLTPLRIQDIASSPQSLEAGLFEDAYAAASKAATGGTPDADLESVVENIVLPLARHPSRAVTSEAVAQIVLQAISTRLPKMASYCTLDAKQKAIALSGAAVLKCLGVAADKKTELAACTVPLFVQSMESQAKASCGGGTSYSAPDMALANAIASDYMLAITITNKEGGSRARLVHAMDGLFASIQATDSNCNDDKKICGPAIAHEMFEAVLTTNTNKLIALAERVLIGKLATEKLDANDKGKRQRGLQLVGGLLEYAQTYSVPESSPGDDSAEKAAFDRRTEIIKSLSEEMTDRTGRVDDWILSFGGSLRAQAGGRFKDGRSAWLGPISLPIGFGLQSSGSWGFEAELNAFDLGQYVSFNETGSVAKPNVEDALSPSVAVGFFFGKQLPFTVMAVGGYSPHYQFASGPNESRGAFSIGLSAGFYVPLFDIN